jgi:hypothetical protein
MISVAEYQCNKEENNPSIFINGKNMTSEEFDKYQRNWMNENTND